ncbi:MAG: response regulator [Candidatus Omnitrophica bacterium]|nr:response regulator [Candidatus Omnitrophota bacterium]
MALRILVIDDEPDLVKAIKIRLNQVGFEVVVAYNGEEGAIKAKEEKPDLILLDVLMPEMDGFQTIKKLKKDLSTKSIPVIMLTAKSQLDDVIEATDLGAADYVVKPFDYRILVEKIKKSIG